uniref:DDE Tnp4 domain-containing protein n=1 Tax=Panagrellus redivivus TaxID=6233 RepID=A0A7E4VG83_PANRE
MDNKRLPINLDKLEFDMSCKTIRRQYYFPKKPLSNKEATFPLAFARAVYKAWITRCSKLNWLQSTHHKTFTVIPLILMLIKHLHLACLTILRDYQSWKYVALLQNHDVAIKTNTELVQIYKWLNGSNDVGVGPTSKLLYNQTIDRTFRTLKILRNTSKNTNQTIKFATSQNQCSLSRAAVDYIFDELDLTLLIKNINTDTYGIDEILMSTLNADDAINLPGGFTQTCIDDGVVVKDLTRYQHWESEINECPSGGSRHGICLIGIEFLVEIEKWPAMFANKVYPEFDYGAYECMRERMFNRTYNVDELPSMNILNETAYKTFLPVCFHREEQKYSFSNEKFDCKS